MNVTMGGAPVGAEETPPVRALPGPEGRTRREVARGLRAGVLAAVLTPVLTAFRFPAGGAPRDTGFDTTYRGRCIRGVRMPARSASEGDRWHVTVDGRPLHLMRRADGTWLSTVDHYSSHRTPLEATRAAVDALAPGQRLRDHQGGPHGVRA